MKTPMMVEPEKVREIARQLPFTKELERDVWVALSKFEMFIGTVKMQHVEDPYVWFFDHAENRFQFHILCELYKVVFAALTMVTGPNKESVNVMQSEPPEHDNTDYWSEFIDRESGRPYGTEDESAWDPGGWVDEEDDEWGGCPELE